jgi:hypothetical protein
MGKEIEKFKTKQDIEYEALQARIKSAYGEFKRDRALEFDNMMLKYKNRIKDLEKAANYDIKNFSKILKGVASKIFF